MLAVPPWLRMVLVGLVVAMAVGGGGWWLYRAFDPLYPQDLWRYFRPAPAAPAGTVLYRDLEGQLFVAPLGDLKAARRLLDANAAAGGREFVRDAVFLPDKERIAYFATVRRDAGGEQDRVKVIGRDGRQVADINVSEAAGEPIRPTVYASVSGRYLAVTNRERTRVFYYDLNTNGPLVPGEAETPPERMLWTRNADLRTPPLPSQQAFAVSGDGKLRAQVRAGRRRAPECEEQRCETTQELTVSLGTVAGSQLGGAMLYGVFSAFSSEGWGPVPPQPAQRLYGRLVWSPDGKQLLFTTLDGESTNTFAIGTDGRSQPRLVLANAEALDWLAS
ncbi:MAG: hypothetical protein ACR2NO_08640 [Chloroflexota bacterium]